MNQTSTGPAKGYERDARAFAVLVLGDVIHRRLSLDERLERLAGDPYFVRLNPSDRGLTRAIATVSMRWLGLIRRTINKRLERGMPENGGSLELVLIAATAQILFLDVPDYAAVDTAIEMIRQDRRAERYTGLANAVLRRIGRERSAILAGCNPVYDVIPAWLSERWTNAYGADAVEAIAAAHAQEAPLDVTAKGDPAETAALLGGELLPTGTIRITDRRPVPELPGFAEGSWWIQDASAAIPARLLKVRSGQTALDLCAAPGGKTAQLAATGARVVAVDRSAPRMQRLKQNLARLNLEVTCHVADGLVFNDGVYSHILLDAPCSATGTIRRHPDVGWNKTLSDIASLCDLQSRLLDHAWTLLAPGGTLVYATCSMEREEGENQIKAFLDRHGEARVDPILPQEVGGLTEAISSEGYLRMHSAHLIASGGCDGFFSARINKPH